MSSPDLPSPDAPRLSDAPSTTSTSRSASAMPSTDASTLALLSALRELGSEEDPQALARRGLRLARTMTGARSAVLEVVDDQYPEDPLVSVLRDSDEGVSATHGSLGGLGEDGGGRVSDGSTVLTEQIHIGARRFGVLRLHDLPPTVGRRERVALDSVAFAIGARMETLRQLEISELHERITDAVWEVDRTLTDQVDLDVTLPLLVARTRELTRAAAVALVGRTASGAPRVLATSRRDGAGAGGPETHEGSTGAGGQETHQGTTGDETGDPIQAQLAALQPDVEEAQSTGRARHWTRHGTSPRPDGVRRRWTSLVPVETRGDPHVVLVVHDWVPPRGVPQHQVQDIISALALHAGIALDREQGGREHDLVTLLEDRDRIARDLHDLVIQRLFAIGLTLQGASRRAGSPELVERLDGAVSELDQTIRDIRATIFELRHHPGQGSFRADLRALVDSYAPTLGFAPTLHVHGPLDSVPDDELHTQVLMVVREALSNVTRHAHASSVQVTARVTADSLSVMVQDDGVGIRGDTVESGLANVRARAADRGGRVRLDPATPRGTCLEWSVPIS